MHCRVLQTLLHPDAHEEGGLGFVDKQLLETQRQAILDLIKEVRIRILMKQLAAIAEAQPVALHCEVGVGLIDGQLTVNH